MPEPTLDEHPILWREWHRRPSAWIRIIWWLYAVLTTACTILALIVPDNAGGTNGLSIAIALLILSALSATVLAEERVQGNLDVLMATPLPTREIVLGKWWGAFRASAVAGDPAGHP
jgi:ABC-type transport system involved in multi-copper enzyme maturation permease subunit